MELDTDRLSVQSKFIRQYPRPNQTLDSSLAALPTKLYYTQVSPHDEMMALYAALGLFKQPILKELGLPVRALPRSVDGWSRSICRVIYHGVEKPIWKSVFMVDDVLQPFAFYGANKDVDV
ncbi:hypothetical protein BYT27DRAFT_6744030 [Phlegmacium glaucopus]|nr:hypothetical protein BYT27DRAFT_6744030 [Phlegmacium glaucopus]